MALRRLVGLRATRAALAVAALVGCSSPTQPDQALPYPAAIGELVEASPFPQRQPVVASALPEGSTTWLFGVRYGPPLDCPSGCFFSEAFGLMNGSKIAWFHIDNYSAIDFSALPLYALGPEDANLFSQAFMDALFEAQFHIYHQFLDRAALSTHIGPVALLAVIARVDETNELGLVPRLVSNPDVRSNCALIRALAARPLRDSLRPEVDALLADCPAG